MARRNNRCHVREEIAQFVCFNEDSTHFFEECGIQHIIIRALEVLYGTVPKPGNPVEFIRDFLLSRMPRNNPVVQLERAKEQLIELEEEKAALLEQLSQRD